MNKLVIPISLLCLALLMTVACTPQRRSYSLDDFCKFDGSAFDKVDNPEATDVSFGELMLQLRRVEAKEYEFTNLLGSCGWYAEAVHNELENNGIRAAIVFVFIGDGSTVHVFNAFEAIDSGRIYADMTGGVLAIAEKVDGEYRFVKHEENQTQIQELGFEKDFYIFW